VQYVIPVDNYFMFEPEENKGGQESPGTNSRNHIRNSKEESWIQTFFKNSMDDIYKLVD